MRHIRISIALFLVVVSASAGELQQAGRDVKSLATAPVHWDAREWKRFGEGIGAVLLVAAADRPIMDAIQRNRPHWTDEFSKRITPLGGHDALLTSVALIAGGWAVHDNNVLGAGRDSLESELWAAGVITPALKRLAGRSRPFLGEGTYHFNSDLGVHDAHESFPSGHATNVFAAATAIAGHYDNWVVPTIVYSIATGVSFSRVHDNVHFPSDVVAGALIGRAVAKGVLARHHVAIVPEKNGLLFVIQR